MIPILIISGNMWMVIFGPNSIPHIEMYVIALTLPSLYLAWNDISYNLFFKQLLFICQDNLKQK